MKILPGMPRGYANETTTSKHLMKYAISNPEILHQLATLWQSKYTPLSSLLAKKGLTSGDLFSSANAKSKNYTVVGNRIVKFPVKSNPNRKGRIVSYSCPAYSDYPGKYQSTVVLYLDTNWFSPYDVLELSDGRTFVTVVDDMLPEQVSNGSWKYYVKLNTRTTTDYINSSLLAAGQEVGFAYTNFYEMSETGYEKYTFDAMAQVALTIQRMKWSISGTAQEMKANSNIWLAHNVGGKEYNSYLTKMDMDMLERWARAREIQMLFGKGTVTDDLQVTLRDMKNRDIMSGDGIVNQGDGSLKFQYNGDVTKGVLHNIMKNMQLYQTNEGIVEVAVIGGQNFIWSFQDLMQNILKVNPQTMVEGTGSNKGVNADVAYYQFGGVRFIPQWYPYFDDPSRPASLLNGERKESSRALFVSIGNTEIGRPNVELLALGKRSFLSGTVSGINDGDGGEISNSVDGKHKHVLSETGIAVVDTRGVAELYIP